MLAAHVKYLLVTVSVLFCFDAFLKGIYVQLCSDMIFKKFVNDNIDTESLSQQRMCTKLIKNLFILFFISYLAWLSYAT